jgi:hypothetical protein
MGIVSPQSGHVLKIGVTCPSSAVAGGWQIGHWRHQAPLTAITSMAKLQLHTRHVTTTLTVDAPFARLPELSDLARRTENTASSSALASRHRAGSERAVHSTSSIDLPIRGRTGRAAENRFAWR